MLDLFFKKYAWTANLVLLFAAAWLCARTVNTVVAALIRSRPAVDLTSATPGPARPSGPARLEPDRLYVLIGQKPPPLVTASEGAASRPKTPQNCADLNAAPVKSGLRAQLVAGVVSDHPRSSIASILDLSARETRVYGVGDQLLGATLLSVERLRDERDPMGTGFKVAAIVCNNGQKEFVDFDPGDGSAAAVAIAPPRSAGRAAEEEGPATADGVKKLADNKYEVKKKFIEDTLSDLNKIATQARIVPSFKNGVANGFKLFSIQPGSLYSAIGVENGDVIQRINGYEMNSPDKALEVYQKLRESQNIKIEIERNGQTVTKDYKVSGP
ncbi:MAG TPA: type II secretion system protein GspC [Anaeromyxobacteraceae bacterium]|nr:type II secretion system protein GspC [Anaeromyxobacteraceae bacterium]